MIKATVLSSTNEKIPAGTALVFVFANKRKEYAFMLSKNYRGGMEEYFANKDLQTSKYLEDVLGYLDPYSSSRLYAVSRNETIKFRMGDYKIKIRKDCEDPGDEAFIDDLHRMTFCSIEAFSMISMYAKMAKLNRYTCPIRIKGSRW